MEIQYEDLGTLAYRLASGIIPGNYVTSIPQDSNEEYVKKLLLACQRIDHSIKKEYIERYIGMLSSANRETVVRGKLTVVACVDLLSRASIDASGELHAHTIQVMETVPISRGSVESLIKRLLKQESASYISS